MPMPVATNNLVLVLLLLVALPVFGKALPALVRVDPVARAALALFGCLLLGTLWGSTPWGEAMGILGKYLDLALIPLLMLLLRDPATRERSLLAFFSIMIIALALSWAIGLHLLPITPWLRQLIGPAALVENPSIFHSHITQGMLTSYACFLFALRARATEGHRRWLYTLLALLAGADVLFMLQGRTGYLVLLLLLGWLGWTVLRGKGYEPSWRLVTAALVMPVILLMTVYQTIPRFHDRVAVAVTELESWKSGQSNETSSMGTRLEFYTNSLRLLEQRPLLGYGTGGLAAAFEKQTLGTEALPTKNPHNEYLMLAVQVGLLGPLLLLLLFRIQWRCAAQLPAFERDAARGLVLTYAVTCLLNSMLLDHTEGLFFAFMSAWLFANLNARNRDA